MRIIPWHGSPISRKAVAEWIFVAFLLLVYFANLLGPPPERVEEIAYLTLTMWLLPFWAWSFDRRRIVA